MGFTVNKTATVKLLSYPYTVAFWAYLDPALSQSVYFYYQKTSDPSSHKEYVLVSMTQSVFYAVASSWNSLSNEARARIDPSLPATAGWHHICGVFAASNDRRIYVNNAKSTYGVNLTPSLPSGDVTVLCSGKMADLSSWNVALTDADVESMYSGISSLKIKRDNILHHIPAVGAEQDMIQGSSFWSDSGTVNLGTHPPIIGAIAA